jgi:hypothetical protein
MLVAEGLRLHALIALERLLKASYASGLRLKAAYTSSLERR